jgi:hypothetical protein
VKLAAHCSVIGVPWDYHKLFEDGDPVYTALLVAICDHTVEKLEEQREG